MTRDQYLNLPVVKDFIDWMSKRLDAEKAPFPHSYSHRREKNHCYTFSSLADAVDQYLFKGKNFEATQECLNNFSKDLKNALEKDDTEELANICHNILAWGNINNGDPANLKDRASLISRLEKAKQELNPLSFDTEKDLSGIRANSGLIKIYSLLIDNFLMYDSRVGAALCWLVRHFCEETEQEFVPSELAFVYDDKRGDKHDTRNPSKGHYQFLKFNSREGKRDRLRLTVQASWILEAVLDKTLPSSQFNTKPFKDHRFWALEAALFMVGYKVKKDEIPSATR
ncbi:MAG: hypothetical protein LBR16_00240 [Treponema sp.]|jgi:hypothetical protein|nr:hypothetical protein [Treponema sp.]